MTETATTASHSGPTRARLGTVLIALLADVLIVVFFAVYGRASHGMNMLLAENLRIAWPFLVGLAVGWAVCLAWKRPLAPLRSGIPITLVTVVIGMTLRYTVAQPGTPVSWIFVGISAGLFAVLFIGWRGIATLIHNLRAP